MSDEKKSLSVFGFEIVGKWDEIEINHIPIDRLILNDWNPNEQSPETFNQLTAEIGTEGFDQPIQVCPVLEKDGSFNKETGQYKIIGGEHRYKVMEYLGREHIPSVIKETWNEEEQKIKTVRRNLMTGDMNPKKFTELVNSLETEYDLDREYLADAMGFQDEAEFQRYYKEEKEKKTEEEQQILDHMNKEINFVDDISSIVSDLMREYGDTMPSGIIGFYFKKKPVFISSCNSKLANIMHKFIQKAEQGDDVDVRQELIDALEPAVKDIKLDKERPTYKALEGGNETEVGESVSE